MIVADIVFQRSGTFSGIVETDICIEDDEVGSVGVDAVELVKLCSCWSDCNNFCSKRRACSGGILRKGVRHIDLFIVVTPRIIFKVISHCTI